MDYTDKLTRIDTSTIFKARTRMLDIKKNTRGLYQNDRSRGGNAETETQDHVLNTYKNLEIMKSARRIGILMAKLAKGGASTVPNR